MNINNFGPCVNPISGREPRIFKLQLETSDQGYPEIVIKVSEYELIEVIRVLSRVYFITMVD